ncbi:hypothetical protein [Umezawaea sp. Da 62-37]|uniref:hypothetical protein n=1 Tax=Umezawaea sp. Da 62-37 TaxID=3075927 RepID=UPI0028F74A5C|nr:hypothetical protein [Umezawaea sp. Da 62-37]WNV91219.1 hypothetical protein RM788_23970 [Umezawaea sp. Da 62-37]
MDEKKLAELFNDAVRDAPPPSFDAGDVRTASDRETRRRRSAVALGSTMAAVVLFGGVALGAGLFTGEASNSADRSGVAGSVDVPKAATPYGAQSAESAPDERGVPSPNSVPGGTSLQGEASSGSVSPPADGTPSGCTVDRELANALAGELPADASTAVAPAAVTCPTGSKAASYAVDGGAFYAVVTPGRQPLDDAAGAPLTGKPTKNGNTLYVVTDAPAFATRVDAISSKLRGKF